MEAKEGKGESETACPLLLRAKKGVSRVTRSRPRPTAVSHCSLNQRHSWQSLWHGLGGEEAREGVYGWVWGGAGGGGRDVVRVGSAGLVARLLKLREMWLRTGRVEVSCLSATTGRKKNKNKNQKQTHRLSWETSGSGVVTTHSS